MIAYGEHPADAERTCAQCERETPHLFRETRIVDGAPHVREAHRVECVVCGYPHDIEGDVHADYGCDELGWVVARRVPRAEASSMSETVRPGTAWADAGAA